MIADYITRCLFVTALILGVAPIHAESAVELRKKLNALPMEKFSAFGDIEPSVNCIYFHSGREPLVVRAVVDDACVLVAVDNPQRGLVVVSNRSYAKGSRLASGLYKAIDKTKCGLDPVETKDLLLFEELTAQETASLAKLLESEAKLTSEKNREVSLGYQISDVIAQTRVDLDVARLAIKNDATEHANMRELARIHQAKELEISELRAQAEEDRALRDAENKHELDRRLHESESRIREMRLLAAQKRQSEQNRFDQEMAKKQEAEQPKEQAIRAMEAQELFKTLDLNKSHYFCVQRSIKKYVKVDILDEEWNGLLRAKEKADWLGMIKVLMDDEELEEYPRTDITRQAILRFKAKEFVFSVAVDPCVSSRLVVGGYSNMWGFADAGVTVYGEGVNQECLRMPFLNPDMTTHRYPKVAVYANGDPMHGKTQLEFEEWMATH